MAAFFVDIEAHKDRGTESDDMDSDPDSPGSLWDFINDNSDELSTCSSFPTDNVEGDHSEVVLLSRQGKVPTLRNLDHNKVTSVPPQGVLMTWEKMDQLVQPIREWCYYYKMYHWTMRKTSKSTMNTITTAQYIHGLLRAIYWLL